MKSDYCSNEQYFGSSYYDVQLCVDPSIGVASIKNQLLFGDFGKLTRTLTRTLCTHENTDTGSRTYYLDTVDCYQDKAWAWMHILT